MSKQDILNKIEAIHSPIGLSGFISSLSKDMKEDTEVVKASMARQKVISKGLMELRAICL